MGHWILLYIAILLEVVGTTAMKLSHGFTQGIPTTAGVCCYVASLSCLTLALKKLEMGPAYAIWAGLGTTCVAVIGILYFDDQVSGLKLMSLLLVVAGVVGLNFSGVSH